MECRTEVLPLALTVDAIVFSTVCVFVEVSVCFSRTPESLEMSSQNLSYGQNSKQVSEWPQGCMHSGDLMSVMF